MRKPNKPVKSPSKVDNWKVTYRQIYLLILALYAQFSAIQFFSNSENMNSESLRQNTQFIWIGFKQYVLV